MYINLYTFAKRENSTLQPTGTGTQYDCYLKEGTSVVSPVIVIDFGDAASPAAHIFNYAYIPDFGRYYFITDVVSTGYLWEYSMQTDILATYKSNIAASTLYLTRCSSQYDGAVMDNFYPVKTSHTVNVQTMTTPWIHDNTENVSLNLGCFILGIVGDPTNAGYSAFGSVKYIAMDRANLNALVAYLLDANNLTSENVTISGLSDEAVKSVIDPLQFIKSCQWCPLQYTDISTTEVTSGLDIWSWTVSVNYKPMRNSPPYYVWSVSFASIAKHPLAATRGTYLNCAPYTKLLAIIPPFGLIELDTTLAAPVTTIIGLITYDIITGSATLEIHYGTGVSGAPSTRLKSQVGVPVQLSQVYNDYISAAQTGIGGVVGNLLSGNIVGAIGSAVGSAVTAMTPVQSSLGGNGGFSDLRGQARLYSIFYDVPAEDLSHVGRPLCQNVTINTLSSGSYCVAMDGDISISGTAGEQAALKAYLEGGFYYE